MAEITASLVKELRERTGAGMMDCKKALTEANGDIELAIENMRKSGAIKAAKKAGNVAADGVIKTKIDGNYGIILEVNCQTDFVAKDAGSNVHSDVFNQLFVSAFSSNQNADTRTVLIRTQNVAFQRSNAANVDVFTNFRYQRNTFFFELCFQNFNVSDFASNSCVQNFVCERLETSKPEFIKPEDVSAEVVEKEYQVQLDIAMQSGKPKEIAEKMVEGRMKKFTGEVSLTGQPFVMEPSKTVGQLLKEHNAEVTGFIRFEVGEGIEKVETDFAAEVAAMSKQS